MSHPYFLEKVERAALDSTTIPLWGSPPPFPFREFSEVLCETFEIKDCPITVVKTEWKNQEDLLEGMGQNPLIQCFCLSPLRVVFFWIMPQTVAEKLLKLLLRLKENSFLEPSLKEGFHTYVFVTLLEKFNLLNPFENLTASLAELQEFPKEGGLAIDLSIQFEKTPLWGRILIPKKMAQSFKSHFKTKAPSFAKSPQLSSLPLTLSVQVGSTAFFQHEWGRVKKGDFVLLDRCMYDIKGGKKNGLLTLNDTPLFEVRIKEGGVKLLEYAFIQEVSSMGNNPNHSSSENAEEPLWASQNGEDRKPFISGNIPISLSVEIGRIQMPLEKVMQLKPGNILELGVPPDPDVYLVVSGKRIAKGELVQLGEVLGVKILDLGD